MPFINISSSRASCLVVCLVLGAAPAAAFSGQIYGTIVENGRPLAGANVVLECPAGRDSKPTSPSGAYRLFVRGDGQCTMTINGASVIEKVYLYASPTRYNFVGVKNMFKRQ